MEMSRQDKDVTWLSKKTGYPEKSLHQWLSGAKEPKASILIRMLTALQLRLTIDKI